MQEQEEPVGEIDKTDLFGKLQHKMNSILNYFTK
jgi:hypothetical protein